jgi:hypothetical protein
MSLISLNVRFQGQPGPHLLAVSFSQFDPNRNSAIRSLDHLVSAGDQHRRNFEAERFGSIGVDL